MDSPAWATDASLGAVAGRLARIGEVECHMEGWTRAHDARPLAETLQNDGIDATPVLDLGDLHDDPQLAHRRTEVDFRHRRHRDERDAFSRRPATSSRALGQHTSVLRGPRDVRDEPLRSSRACELLRARRAWH
jgi:crotonobetainyl-CoA:carnitine CoA-transferase CaiB-like acyl-CoA transferase